MSEYLYMRIFVFKNLIRKYVCYILYDVHPSLDRKKQSSSITTIISSFFKKVYD